MSQMIAPVWASGGLPDYIERLPLDVGVFHYNRFKKLTHIRSDEVYESPWPNQDLTVLALQHGFWLPGDEGSCMDLAVRDLSPKGVVCWATDSPDIGYFRAKYDHQLRHWMEKGLVMSPVSLIAIDVDLLLIIDDLLVFSVIAGDEGTMKKVAAIFHGPNAMRINFEQSVAAYYPDPNDRLGSWIRRNVLQACTW